MAPGEPAGESRALRAGDAREVVERLRAIAERVAKATPPGAPPWRPPRRAT